MADESSQRRLLVVIHQADRDGDLRPHRLSEGHRRTESQPHRHGAGERCARAYEEVRSGRGARPAGADAGREQARSPASITSASPPRGRDGSTIRRARNITPPTRSCRRPARSRSTFCAITSGWCPRKDGEKIVYDLAPLNGPVASGDIVAVRLTVTGSEWKYLMVEDPIPAGHRVHRARQRLRIEVAPAVVAVLLHAPRTA